MHKQSYYPKDSELRNADSLSTLGLQYPLGVDFGTGKEWFRQQVCRDETFSLVTMERFNRLDEISCTRQEDYVKIGIWLGGEGAAILDGYGQIACDRPQVFVLSGPPDMIKVDLLKRESPISAVAICIRRAFFTQYMQLGADDLPEPFGRLLRARELSHVLAQLPLTPELASASRAMLAVSPSVRMNPLYARAKSIELMCLVIDLLRTQTSRPGASIQQRRHAARLRKAHDLIAKHYAEPLTLESICTEVGLNRVALSVGFNRLYGRSVHEFLTQCRMERAYALLQEDDDAIGRVAEAVGFSHACNFSTVFRTHFGCTPRQMRSRRSLKITI